MNALVVPQAIVDEMFALFDAAPLESAGVLFCYQARGKQSVKLLAQEFVAYADCDYIERQSDRIAIDPIAVNDRIQSARRAGLSIVQVHTHPFSDDGAFSDADTRGEQEMLPVIFRRVPGTLHGTLVLGRKTSAARIYTSARAWAPARIVTVGKNLRRLDFISGRDEDRYARSYRALGKDAQVAMQETHVGIVGLGGLGSQVAEQLAYLGVQNVVMLDHDTLEESNLNRVVGALPEDIGESKVDVAAARYRSILPGAHIDPIVGSALDEEYARSLVDCDLIFCCTDNHGSRAVLNWIAYQYLIPVIDTGVEIAVDKLGAVSAIAGRVQLLGTGMPCLHCCESLNMKQVREDLLSKEERERDQYIVGGDIPQPAVVTLNGVVASVGTTMFLGMTTSLPIQARMQMFNGITGQIRPAESSVKEGCPVCSNVSTVVGRGDSVAAIWRKKT